MLLSWSLNFDDHGGVKVDKPVNECLAPKKLCFGEREQGLRMEAV